MWTLAGFADEISPDPAAQCELLAQLGVRWVELRGAWDVGVLDLDDEQLERLQGVLATAGLRVSSVASPIGKVPIGDDFDEHLRRFDRALAVADRLAAPHIRLFSFYIPPGDDPAAHRDEVLARIAALVERAAGHDVLLAHENEHGIYGDSPERCLDIIESIGSERLRLIWDPGNFVVCGGRPHRDGYALLRPHLAYVHVKDVRVDPASGTAVAVPAGEGDGEIAETIRALRDDRFDGFFSLEPHLAIMGAGGGFSGAELFATAHAAFVALLEREAIEHR
jgi:sugar phosphate isomerase/epimerase